MKTRFPCHPGTVCFIHSKGFTTAKIMLLKTREKERKCAQGFRCSCLVSALRETGCSGVWELQRDGASPGWAARVCLLLPTREGNPGLSLGEGASSLLTFQLTLLYSDISSYSAQLPQLWECFSKPSLQGQGMEES